MDDDTYSTWGFVGLALLAGLINGAASTVLILYGLFEANDFTHFFNRNGWISYSELKVTRYLFIALVLGNSYYLIRQSRKNVSWRIPLAYFCGASVVLFLTAFLIFKWKLRIPDGH